MFQTFRLDILQDILQDVLKLIFRHTFAVWVGGCGGGGIFVTVSTFVVAKHLRGARAWTLRCQNITPFDSFTPQYSATSALQYARCDKGTHTKVSRSQVSILFHERYVSND